MSRQSVCHLDRKKRYLQVALNSTLEDAQSIISRLPKSDRVLVEVGTPLIKRYGEYGIKQIKQWYSSRLIGLNLGEAALQKRDISLLSLFLGSAFRGAVSDDIGPKNKKPIGLPEPYVVADLKTMDRGETEVEIAARGGANAAVALATAPIETIDSFIAQCEAHGLDAMLDMMNVEYPLGILHKLKKIPPVIILHRGVDEEKFNKEKQIPLHEIRRIKGTYDVMISIAGGDTIREVQRSVFNDADIVVIWKSVYQSTNETIGLVEEFIKEIK